MTDKLTESFEWSKGLDGLPKDRLLKAVAKTLRPTIHTEDPAYPVRVFAEEELMKNARSLIGRPVGLNHAQIPIYGAYVVDSEWNEPAKQLEAILFLPPEYIRRVAEGLIKNVSIEYTWRDTEKTEVGTRFKGLGITRVDLVEGLPPGDPAAVVSLFETAERRGVVLAEVTTTTATAPETPPTPVAPMAPAPPAPTPAPTAPLPGTPPAPVEDVAELKAAVTRLSNQLTEQEQKHHKEVADAVRKAKQELAAKVDAALIKNPMIMRHQGARLARMANDVKKALGEAIESNK